MTEITIPSVMSQSRVLTLRIDADWVHVGSRDNDYPHNHAATVSLKLLRNALGPDEASIALETIKGIVRLSESDRYPDHEGALHAISVALGTRKELPTEAGVQFSTMTKGTPNSSGPSFTTLVGHTAPVYMANGSVEEVYTASEFNDSFIVDEILG